MTSLKPLPFVTSLPGEDQKSIDWIRNGVLLEGASTKLGHDGILNKASVQIQENVVVIDANTKILELGLALVNESVKDIEDSINSSGTANIIEAVKSHGETIERHESHLEEIDTSVDELNTKIDETLANVGIRSEESGTLSVFDDLLFIKTRIGSNDNEDINGLPSTGDATGLIRKLQDTTFQAINNKNSLDAISEEITNLELPKTKAEVNELRVELGESKNATGTPVYGRLKAIEDHSTELDDSISKISTAIGLGSRDIASDVDLVTSDVNNLKTLIETPSTGLVDKVKTIDTALNDSDTGVIAKVTLLESNISEVDTRLGKTGTGLVGKVEELESFVGKNDGTPSQDSLAGKLTTLTALHNDTAASVQDMQVELGTSNSGLIGDVKAIKETLAEQDTQLKAFDERIKALEEKVKALESA